MEYQEAMIKRVCADPSTGETKEEQIAGKIAIGTGLGYWIGEPDPNDPSDKPIYCLTHLASGFRMQMFICESEQAVQELLERIAPLRNWNCTAQDLVLDPAYPAMIETQVQSIMADVANKYAEYIPEWNW